MKITTNVSVIEPPIRKYAIDDVYVNTKYEKKLNEMREIDSSWDKNRNGEHIGECPSIQLNDFAEKKNFEGFFNNLIQTKIFRIQKTNVYCMHIASDATHSTNPDRIFTR